MFHRPTVSETKGINYQTVRGVFLEGKPAFAGSKIMLKSHIQIAVKDYSCVPNSRQTARVVTRLT